MLWQRKNQKRSLYIILGIILVLILALVFSFGLKKGNGAIEVTVAKAEKAKYNPNSYGSR